MAFTLTDFISANIVPGMRLLTENIRFSSVAIQGVSVQEAPPFRGFVFADEIILTSCGSGADQSSYLKQLIEACGESDVAALLIALADEEANPDKELIQYANDCGINMFRIPSSISFPKIQASLFDALRSDTRTKFEGLQKSLFEIYLESGSLAQASKLIFQSFKCPVLITNFSNASLAHYGVVSFEQKDEDKEYEDGYDNDFRLNFDISISGIKYGTLCFFTYHDEEVFLEQHREEIERYIALPLSLWLTRQKMENAEAARLRNDFVWNLANENYDSYEEMTGRGVRLGFEMGKPYTCIIMKMGEREGLFGASNFEANAAQATALIEDLLRQKAKQTGLAAMTASLGLTVVGFLETPSITPTESIDTILDETESVVTNKLPDVRCLWGISSTEHEPHNFPAIYREASQAYHYCLAANGVPGRFAYKHTYKAMIMAELSQINDVKKSAEEVFCKLREYDKTASSNLMETLIEYISTNYNASKTAQNLHLNRQSLLYRLQKISSLTGMNLHSHEDLFVLEVFSRIYVAY